MRNHDLEKFIKGLEPEKMLDLGVGLGLLRYAEYVAFNHAIDELQPDPVANLNPSQVLAVIELGMVEWMCDHPEAVAEVVSGWVRLSQGDIGHPELGGCAWPFQSGIPESPVALAMMCMEATAYCAAEDRSFLLVQMTRAAAQAVTVGAPLVISYDDITNAAGEDGYLLEFPIVAQP